MSNVTPIRPEPPAALNGWIEPQCRRLFQAQAIMELVERAIKGYSGDEDSLKIAVELCGHAMALEAARGLVADTVGMLERMAGDVDEEAPPV